MANVDWNPDTYLATMEDEIQRDHELQEQVAAPTGSTTSSTGCAMPASRPSPCGPTRISRSFRLRAGRDQDEVGGEAEEDAEQHAPGDERLRREQAAHVQQLGHDVENRSRREGE